MKELYLETLYLLGSVNFSVGQNFNTPDDSLWTKWNDKNLSDSVRDKTIQILNWNSMLFNNSDSAIVRVITALDFTTEKELLGSKYSNTKFNSN